MRGVLSGLPVARFSGNLAYRFTKLSARSGRGVVRAKTGTLAHVNGLAGTVVDHSGAELVFVVLTDQVPTRETLAARAGLDRIAATLARCGCR